MPSSSDSKTALKTARRRRVFRQSQATLIAIAISSALHGAVLLFLLRVSPPAKTPAKPTHIDFDIVERLPSPARTNDKAPQDKDPKFPKAQASPKVITPSPNRPKPDRPKPDKPKPDRPKPNRPGPEHASNPRIPDSSKKDSDRLSQKDPAQKPEASKAKPDKRGVSKTIPSLLSMRSKAPAPLGTTTSLTILAAPDLLLQGDQRAKAKAIGPVGTNSRSQGATDQTPKQPGLRIGDYHFARERGGKLTYRDPAKDFLASILPDGSVEFESRAAAKVGLCTLGMCITTGGVRKKHERKRMQFNRIRIRFAPIPIALMANFGSTRGIPKKQLDLLRATFERRFLMRRQHLLKLQNKALAQLPAELRRIWNSYPRIKAKAIITQRALEVHAPQENEVNTKDLDPESRRLSLELQAFQRSGAEKSCQLVLHFAQARHESKIPQGFRASEIQNIKGHCLRLAR